MGPIAEPGVASQTPGRYPVTKYLSYLELSGRSDATIASYRKTLKGFADYLNVPLDDLHSRMDVDSLIAYAKSCSDRSPNGNKTRLSILSRYMRMNGVVFDEMERQAARPRVTKEYCDKPLTVDLLRKMMDLTDAHGRAIITFLVSTGCRPGEAAQVLLSDVKSDVVTIRNEIAKGGRGGKVYLTAEAREYLDLWLRERDRHLQRNQRRTRGIQPGSKGPAIDKRLFGIKYSSLLGLFSRLYRKVDGERGKYGRNRCSPHSCRRYFRTVAAKELGVDITDKIMRHTGAYLSGSYVRLNDEEIREAFHRGEHALYVTREHQHPDRNEIEILKQERSELEDRMILMEKRMEEITAGRSQ
jgi:integrase